MAGSSLRIGGIRKTLAQRVENFKFWSADFELRKKLAVILGVFKEGAYFRNDFLPALVVIHA